MKSKLSKGLTKEVEVVKIKKCTDVSSALNYIFTDTKTDYFYFDPINKKITKSKFGTDFYMDNDNCIFRDTKYHKIITNDEVDHIHVFALGPIRRNSLHHHNIIANIIYQ